MNMFKKTTAKTPDEYIALQNEPRKGEIQNLHNFIKKTIPNQKPYIESGMIGYGKFHMRYKSGKELDWFLVGLANQKNYISVYVCAANSKQYVTEKYKDKLPKASIGKSCIRFKKTEDIDLNVLGQIIKEGEKMMRENKISF